MRTDRSKICIHMALMILILTLMFGCHPVDNSDEQGPLTNLNNFTAYTRKGKPYTQEEFGDYDITIICFWAPWSDASIYELKNLVTLSDRLPENVGFISVCLDSDLKESKNRLKELNLDGFITLIEGDGDFKVLSDAIVNVPTSIIVDNSGTIIGGPIIGIQDSPEKKYVKAMNAAMKKTGGKRIVLTESTEEESTEEESTEEESTEEESTEEESTEEDRTEVDNTEEDNTKEESKEKSSSGEAGTKRKSTKKTDTKKDSAVSTEED